MNCRTSIDRIDLTMKISAPYYKKAVDQYSEIECHVNVENEEAK